MRLPPRGGATASRSFDETCKVIPFGYYLAGPDLGRIGAGGGLFRAEPGWGRLRLGGLFGAGLHAGFSKSATTASGGGCGGEAADRHSPKRRWGFIRLGGESPLCFRLGGDGARDNKNRWGGRYGGNGRVHGIAFRGSGTGRSDSLVAGTVAARASDFAATLAARAVGRDHGEGDFGAAAVATRTGDRSTSTAPWAVARHRAKC